MQLKNFFNLLLLCQENFSWRREATTVLLTRNNWLLAKLKTNFFFISFFSSIVPLVGPWIEKYDLSSNGSVQIYWRALSENDKNGIIRGYSIFYETLCKDRQNRSSWHSGVVNVSAPLNDYVMNYTLNELRPGFGYSVRMAAFTSKGTGPKYHAKHVWTSKWNFPAFYDWKR